MLMIHLKKSGGRWSKTNKNLVKKRIQKHKEREKGKEENVRNVKIAHTSAFSLRKLVDSPHMDFVLYLEPCKIY